MSEFTKEPEQSDSRIARTVQAGSVAVRTALEAPRRYWRQASASILVAGMALGAMGNSGYGENGEKPAGNGTATLSCDLKVERLNSAHNYEFTVKPQGRHVTVDPSYKLYFGVKGEKAFNADLENVPTDYTYPFLTNEKTYHPHAAIHGTTSKGKSIKATCYEDVVVPPVV